MGNAPVYGFVICFWPHLAGRVLFSELNELNSVLVGGSV